MNLVINVIFVLENQDSLLKKFLKILRETAVLQTKER